MNQMLNADVNEGADAGESNLAPSLWLTLLLTAAAGGMGWGIRGQYGHQTGAMIAGVLVALVIGVLYCRRHSSLFTARFVAMTAVGISFGGSMTYGQTVGLTHDAELHGNWPALWWGMLGLFIKGGVWVGFAGALLGMGLGSLRYSPIEIAVLFLCLIVLLFLGVFLLNEPYDPEHRLLPKIYFSDSWDWEPDKADLRPRRERWGGLLFALAGLLAYVSIYKRDAIARNIGLMGAIFGGIGFAAGQAVQAYHAWNAEQFRDGWIGNIEPYMNWWNMMEITFGAILGMGLGLGIWLNRRQLASEPEEDRVEFTPTAECTALSMHAAAIAAWTFVSFNALEAFADHALTMGILPLILILGGRYSPYLVALPVVLLPIAGKTLRELSYRSDFISPDIGWLAHFALPMTIMLGAAFLLAWRGKHGQSGRTFCRWSLLLASWIYFALNFTFFRLPWPWADWTGRTPSALIFAVCLLLLTGASLASGRGKTSAAAAEQQSA